MTTGEAVFWAGFSLFVAAAYAAGASMTMCGLHAAGCRPRVAALGGLFFPTLPVIGAVYFIGWAVWSLGRALLFGAAPCGGRLKD